MPTNNDETLQQRYEREHRDFERMSATAELQEKWGSYFDGDERVSVYDTEGEAAGELSKLIPALVSALGGEIQPRAALPGSPAGAVTIQTDGITDPLLEQARALVVKEGKASISYVQRVLKIGYNLAARLIETLEVQGVVSPMNATGGRTVLVKGGA